ncbi:uncharacterized protein LOC111344389 [Stylophora pistillata]|uniref:uncharacterized protein LOC111344389 n=1 Tax=Stylophora pistillata TaxID=50429 RepID=UPI000C04E060|nr:uncharacterized protein LOC111344389 [Stylophora pistillata]
MRALALIVIFGVSATFAFGDDEDVNQKNPWRPGKKDETYWLRDQLPVLESVKRQKGMWKPGKKDETHLLGNQLNDLQAPETVKRQHTVWKPGKKDETHWLGNHNAQASTGSMQILNDGKQNDPETQITGMGGVSPPAANIPFPRPGRKRRSMTA